MDNKEIETLSKYRLEQAKENLEEAIVLFGANKFKGANNAKAFEIFSILFSYASNTFASHTWDAT